MIEQLNNQKKHTRILVRKGIEIIALKIQDVALFYTQNRIVYVLDKQGQKYIYDKTLSELEEELDAQEFFRMNRQYIVNIDAIKSFRTYQRVKLQVRLNLENTPQTIIISQHMAPSFRKWIYNA
ncbi:MAG: LytR/AlgR family response regulator transcription factor [Flavisolibacter sp.]